MSASPVCAGSILNRSPFLVSVRADASLSRRSSFPKRGEAQACAASLAARGVKVRLVGAHRVVEGTGLW